MQDELYTLSSELRDLLGQAHKIHLESTISAECLTAALSELSYLASRRIKVLLRLQIDPDGFISPTIAALQRVVRKCSHLKQFSSHITSFEYQASNVENLIRVRPPYAMAVAFQEWYDPINDTSTKSGEEVATELVQWYGKKVRNAMFHSRNLAEVGVRLKADREAVEGAKKALKEVVSVDQLAHSKLTESERRDAEKHWLLVSQGVSSLLKSLK